MLLDIYHSHTSNATMHRKMLFYLELIGLCFYRIKTTAFVKQVCLAQDRALKWLNCMPKLTNPLMKRSSSKESLNDYFWDDLDVTSDDQPEKSILSLLTKNRSMLDGSDKLQKKSTGGFVASQDLVQVQGSDLCDTGTAHAFDSVKSDVNIIAESSNSLISNLSISGCVVSADNGEIVHGLDEASIEKLLSGDEDSDMKECPHNPTNIFAQEHFVADKKKNEHTSFSFATTESKKKITEQFEDNNELPKSFWGNEEDGTDFETKLSLLTLSPKSEKESECSSMLSKFSTDAFLCTMSEVLHSTQDVRNAEESGRSQLSSLYKRDLSNSVALNDQNMANERAVQKKVTRGSVSEEMHLNIVGLKERMADNTDKNDVRRMLSEGEALIPKSGGRALVSDDSGFNFGEYPRILYLQGRQLVAYPTKQKRLDIKSGTEREVVSTLFTFFILNYHLPSIVDLNCTQVVESEPMLSILFSKDVTVDKIINILGLEKIKYVVSDIGNSKGDANELVEMFFLNREVAIKHALENRQWAFALFLSRNTRHQYEVIKEFSMHINPILHPFFGCGEMSDNWKQTFSLLLRNPQDSLVDMFVSRTDGIELIFAVLSFYFIHSRQFSSQHFFNNFYFLKLALRYGIEPVNLDMLILRYLRVMQEEGKDDVSRVYSKYKSRKGVSQWEPKKSWLEGIRNVVEKGISKIVGVDDEIVKQSDHCEETLHGCSDNQLVDSKQHLECGHHEHRSVHSNKHESRDDQVSYVLDSKQNKNTYSHDKKQGTKYSSQADIVVNAPDTADQHHQNMLSSTSEKMETKHTDSISDVVSLQNGVVLHKEEVKEDSCLEKTRRVTECKSTGTDTEQHVHSAWDSVYRSDIRSQSCADLRSLVPADILQEDEAPEKNGKKVEEKKPGFFSRFSLFSKKKTYKVSLNSSEDFKYDSATKKWTSSSSPCESPSSSAPVKKEKPMPAMVSMKKINMAMDGSIKSRYTNNVNVEGEKRSLASLLPKKK